MNPWSSRTLNLVTSEAYLDKLQEIYPHEEGGREVDGEILNSIKRLFKRKDNVALLNKLLDLEKFPYKDSYVGFLRKDRTAISRNPKTVKRICDRLYGMGIDSIIDGVIQPKEANARRGNQFSDWARKKFKFVSIKQFQASTQGIVMLDATELEARNFCNTKMGIGISKRPDMVAKSGKHYIVGEAKFLSSSGGNQGRAFDDGMGLATNASGIAYKVFVLDGIHWIERGSEQYKRIEYGTSAVFSALLLKEFLRSL
jgi:hypothetical protein